MSHKATVTQDARRDDPGYAIITVQDMPPGIETLSFSLKVYTEYLTPYLTPVGRQDHRVWLRPEEAWYSGDAVKLVVDPDITRLIEPLPFVLSLTGEGLEGNIDTILVWPPALKPETPEIADKDLIGGTKAHPIRKSRSDGRVRRERPALAIGDTSSQDSPHSSDSVSGPSSAMPRRIDSRFAPDSIAIDSAFPGAGSHSTGIPVRPERRPSQSESSEPAPRPAASPPAPPQPAPPPRASRVPGVLAVMVVLILVVGGGIWWYLEDQKGVDVAAVQERDERVSQERRSRMEQDRKQEREGEATSSAPIEVASLAPAVTQQGIAASGLTGVPSNAADALDEPAFSREQVSGVDRPAEVGGTRGLSASPSPVPAASQDEAEAEVGVTHEMARTAEAWIPELRDQLARGQVARKDESKIEVPEIHSAELAPEMYTFWKNGELAIAASLCERLAVENPDGRMAKTCATLFDPNEQFHDTEIENKNPRFAFAFYQVAAKQGRATETELLALIKWLNDRRRAPELVQEIRDFLAIYPQLSVNP